MDSIDEYFCASSFSEAIRQVDTKEFDINDEAFWFDKSSSRIVSGSVEDFLKDRFDDEQIANWILDSHGCAIGNEDLNSLVGVILHIEVLLEKIEGMLSEWKADDDGFVVGDEDLSNLVDEARHIEGILEKIKGMLSEWEN